MVLSTVCPSREGFFRSAFAPRGPDGAVIRGMMYIGLMEGGEVGGRRDDGMIKNIFFARMKVRLM